MVTISPYVSALTATFYITRKAEIDGGVVADYDVRLIKSGSIVGNNSALVGNWSKGAVETVSYTFPSNISVSDISSTFGIAISTQFTYSGVPALLGIDSITLVISWNEVLPEPIVFAKSKVFGSQFITVDQNEYTIIDSWRYKCRNM